MVETNGLVIITGYNACFSLWLAYALHSLKFLRYVAIITVLFQLVK